MLVLKPNTRQCNTSATSAASTGVQQNYSRPAAVASRPKSHMDHLADRVSTSFDLVVQSCIAP